MPQRIAKTEKGQIEYRLEGSGPTIVVLNGGHCSRETRLSHERVVEHGFSVLTPSRPGYDDTPPGVGQTAQQAADALAALLVSLQIPTADVIGISAAGPTALAFTQRHPHKVRKLILESAVTTPWNTTLRRLAHIPFGRAQTGTWALIRLVLKVAPTLMIRIMLQQLTTLSIDEVINRMSKDDLMFVQRMIATFQSGT